MNIPGTKILKSKEFTDKIIKSINKIVKEIKKPVKFMHVCGTHEHTLSKYGLRPLLPKEIEILSGPGCPVCVCPAADIDKAIELGKRDDTIITTFGDMIRVPSTKLSLAELKAMGADVRIVYGPHDAVEIARKNPDKEVVFFAIGFETTTLLIGYEIKSGPPSNFSVICAHKLIPAALELLISQSQLRIDGFISPGHVSTIIGLQPFKIFSRVVKPEGNKIAQEVISEVFESVSSPWRGIGRILDGGLAIRDKYEKFDADKKFDIKIEKSQDIPPGCSCHLIMVSIQTSASSLAKRVLHSILLAHVWFLKRVHVQYFIIIIDSLN
ncbi:MAG: hydrogenase formation protein HypD [Promethearchaeota archaeon]